MRDRTRRRPPQGAVTEFKPGDSTKKSRAEYRALLAEHLLAKLHDPQIEELIDALDERDQAKCAELLPVLKARYKEYWNAIVKIVVNPARGIPPR